jgi:hypothetical protein
LKGEVDRVDGDSNGGREEILDNIVYENVVCEICADDDDRNISKMDAMDYSLDSWHFRKGLT